MDIEGLRLLVEIARGGSLSRAAKQRGVAVSTIARRLDRLEAELRLRLIDRGARGAGLTAEGARIAGLAPDLIESAARIARAATAMQAHSDQAVVISATEFVVSDVLAPALPALERAAPGVRIVLRSHGAVVSLAGREADLAVRMAMPEGASLLVRKLPSLPLGLFASPTFLAGCDPAALDLGSQPLLGYDDSYGITPEVAWFTEAGLDGAIVMRTGSTRALLSAAAAGAGIALLPAPIAYAANLVAVPLPRPLAPRTPWLAVHRDVRRLPGVAAVHRWIVASFARFREGAA